ncbi:hypothetical protein L596_020128 [Steinernema carpocapsae]|uniref:Uncharacterized protein n=1 Tax=Steinernema carpocapsae TaxID=34508 RepID=A0A4U5MSM6_STECR|nr:hypothetical protein L596_020128 [Steinernema carpocapsae]
MITSAFYISFLSVPGQKSQNEKSQKIANDKTAKNQNNQRQNSQRRNSQKSKQPTTKQPTTKQPKKPQPAHTAIFETVDHSLLSPVPGGFAAKTTLKNVQA